MTIFGYCVDSSEDAERALRWGLKKLPPREDDKVYLVTVLEIPVKLTAGGATVEESPLHSTEDLRRVEAEGQALLQRFTDLASQLGVSNVEPKMIAPTSSAPRMAAPNLAAWAENAGVDLLVAGRRGLSGAARGLRKMVGMGSQTTWLVENCGKIPVLSIPHDVSVFGEEGRYTAAAPVAERAGGGVAMYKEPELKAGVQPVRETYEGREGLGRGAAVEVEPAGAGGYGEQERGIARQAGEGQASFETSGAERATQEMRGLGVEEKERQFVPGSQQRQQEGEGIAKGAKVAEQFREEDVTRTSGSAA